MNGFYPAINSGHLTDSQQAALYWARKRRRAREGVSASEFNRGQPEIIGLVMNVTLYNKVPGQ